MRGSSVLALGLLGRHVPRRSEDGADLGLDRVELRERRGLAARDHLRDAEVEDLHDLLVPVGGVRLRRRQNPGEEEVVGLEIAMDNALRVRLGEGAKRLARSIHGDRNGEATEPREALPEALALEELHREIELARVAGAEVEDGDRVRRGEERVGARLAEKAGLRVLVDRAVAAEDLDRDLATHRVLLGAIDRAHRAGAEPRGDRVTILEDLPEHRVVLGRGDLALADEARPVFRADDRRLGLLPG